MCTLTVYTYAAPRAVVYRWGMGPGRWGVSESVALRGVVRQAIFVEFELGEFLIYSRKTRKFLVY